MENPQKKKKGSKIDHILFQAFQERQPLCRRNKKRNGTVLGEKKDSSSFPTKRKARGAINGEGERLRFLRVD